MVRIAIIRNSERERKRVERERERKRESRERERVEREREQSPEPRAQSPEPRAQSPEPRAQSPFHDCPISFFPQAMLGGFSKQCRRAHAGSCGEIGIPGPKMLDLVGASA